MLGIYKFHFDCGRRNGCLFGVFIADDKKLQEIVGQELGFGEVLGKHSNVRGILEPSDFSLITQDQEFIAKFQELKLTSGYSPFDGLSKEDKEE